MFNVLFSPTKSFEDAFHEPSMGSALITVLLSSVFISLAVFFMTSQLIPSAYFFVVNLVQWIVLSGIVWFFEFAHVRKRKKMTGTTFDQIASVVGKLWTINLVGSIFLAIVAFILPFATANLMNLLGPLLAIFAIIVLLSWLIASFKMLKVVFGVEKWKLLFNWVLVNLINIVTIAFVSSILIKLFYLV
ncbi:MAG: hypothetical protein WC821_04825 [archaeon]|jgi:hypothetical protein